MMRPNFNTLLFKFHSSPLAPSIHKPPFTHPPDCNQQPVPLPPSSFTSAHTFMRLALFVQARNKNHHVSRLRSPLITVTINLYYPSCHPLSGHSLRKTESLKLVCAPFARCGAGFAIVFVVSQSMEFKPKTSMNC